MGGGIGKALLCACRSRVLAVAVVVLFAASASAGTFKGDIAIDDVYSDWAGVPILDSDPADNGSGVDIADVQVANDDDYLYLHVSYHNATSVSTFLAVDNDNNTGTGYDIFGLGLVGSEAGWQNDFPFDQRGGFNSGPISNGAALLEPAWNVDASDREYAIPRSATFDSDGEPVFPNDTITLLVWADNPQDFTSPISYRFEVPEPASFAIIAFGGLLVVRRRR